MAADPETMSTSEPCPLLLTVKDLEAELQLGRTRTYELVRSGVIPVLRIGRSVRIPREALRRWVEAEARGTSAERGAHAAAPPRCPHPDAGPVMPSPMRPSPRPLHYGG
jgi:excisionase family DNA binding protein